MSKQLHCVKGQGRSVFSVLVPWREWDVWFLITCPRKPTEAGRLFPTTCPLNRAAFHSRAQHTQLGGLHIKQFLSHSSFKDKVIYSLT